MLQSDDLPLAEVVDANQWQEIFDEHEINFGADEDAVYTPSITLWALISQAFFKGEMRSCKAAVGRVAALWATGGKKVCSAINLLLQRSRCLMSRTLTMISPSIKSSRMSAPSKQKEIS